MVKKKKIDPYAAAGIAFGLGKLNSTEDILALGGILGAMGAFDDEPETTGGNEEFSFTGESKDDAYMKELDAEVRRTRRAAERAEVEYRMAMKNQQQILREHAFGCFDREWCLNELLYKLPPRENAEKVLSFLKTGYGKEPFADELFAAYASWLESSKGIRLD